jgi:hypothetical protein
MERKIKTTTILSLIKEEMLYYYKINLYRE